jgi:polyphenol oxidase
VEIIGNLSEGYGFVKDVDAKKDMERVKNFLIKQYSAKTIHTLKQVHSDIILIDSSGTGDGIIITKPGDAGIISTADCFSVALFDRNRKISAIFHSGWRSTELNIVGKGVEKLKELGCDNISAVIFPAIGECCFEIGEELVERFNLASIPVQKRGGKLFADLKSAIIAELRKEGVRNINDYSRCTYCEKSFFSYRRDKTDKRHASFIINIS